MSQILAIPGSRDDNDELLNELYTINDWRILYRYQVLRSSTVSISFHDQRQLVVSTTKDFIGNQTTRTCCRIAQKSRFIERLQVRRPNKMTLNNIEFQID